MTHTPGPWHIENVWNVYAGRRLVAGTGGYSSNQNPEAVRRESIANAVLVAAAPDLLAAAERMLAAAEGADMEAIFDAHAATPTAVKKARGES